VDGGESDGEGARELDVGVQVPRSGCSLKELDREVYFEVASVSHYIVWVYSNEEIRDSVGSGGGQSFSSLDLAAGDGAALHYESPCTLTSAVWDTSLSSPRPNLRPRLE